MKIGLKEIGTVVALATAGCTSPNPEDAKQETPHPVCAVSSDTITWKMVAEIRDKCSREASDMMVDGDSLGPMVAEKMQRKCLGLHGLDPE